MTAIYRSGIAFPSTMLMVADACAGPPVTTQTATSVRAPLLARPERRRWPRLTRPPPYRFAPAIAVDPDGVPHIAYYDEPARRLTLASRIDNRWNREVVDSATPLGHLVSLKLESDGRPGLVFWEVTSCLPLEGAVWFAAGSSRQRRPGQRPSTLRRILRLGRGQSERRKAAIS